MVEKKSSKVAKKFYCEKCDYGCSRKYDYEKHLSTRKHKMVVIDSNLSPKNDKKYFCECGKSYSHDSGYYRHKKTCTFINEEKESNNNGENSVTPEMFMELMKVVVKQGEQVVKQGEQQNNFQNKIVEEIIPKIGNNNNNTTNCNNTTNKFNMNIFLNETCKDAIPLVEFISNLKLTVEDLDNTGKEGLVKGLTDIITKGLNELDITKRPIHCSDIKRETLYIKEEDKWIKDDKDKTIVADAIGKVKREADSFFPKWLEEHPLCWKRDSPYHEQYMTMVTNRFGKGDENFVEKNTKKVIKNIAKEVIVDKENE
jgi:hypothetical protein